MTPITPMDMETLDKAIMDLSAEDKLMLYLVVQRAYQCITQKNMHGLLIYTDEETLHTMTLNTDIFEAANMLTHVSEGIHQQLSKDVAASEAGVKH